MAGRAILLVFVMAVATVHTLPSLPGLVGRCILAVTGVMCAFVGWRCAKRATLRAAAFCMSAACVGASYAVERAQTRLDDGLPAIHENQVARMELRVASLPEQDADGIRFDADVLQSKPADVPTRIRVSWRVQGALPRAVPVAMPGQQWRIAAILKRPHSAQNPHAVDGEARLFQRNIRAIATVRGRPQLLADDPWRSPGIAAHRARYVLRERMQAALADTRYGAVIIALALGDQAAVAREDWTVFNSTGITHLVSISGLHVTLVAGLAGAAVSWTWRRLRWRSRCLAERLPSQIAGISAAICVAWLYCVLAGWGIPAQRTFFTLAVAGLAAILRLPLSISRVLAVAAAVVALLDPWAPIAPGFWLSFGAVAMVLAWTGGAPGRQQAEQGRWEKIRRSFVGASRLQCVVTAGLTPLLAFLTQQVALAAPLANAVAIPAVSFIVTPLALLCAAMCAIPGAGTLAEWAGRLAQWAFQCAMAPVVWLAGMDWAVRNVAAPPAGLLALAIAGICWALLRPAWRSRHWAWLLMLPALCWRPERPAHGAWSLIALDVGQGGAIAVQTSEHTLLFDAGPRHRNGTDSGQRVVWPYLRASGVRRIDTLVLSHADLDHAGGTDSVLRMLPVDTAYAPFDLPSRLVRDARAREQDLAPMPTSFQRCRAGQGWQMDGVNFDFIHPLDDTARPRRSNEGGCVLLIRGQHHSALLPGDIGVAQENRLLDALGPVDLVLAGHHGSATSSGSLLVETVQAAHVIIQVGYLNRFRHPSPAVERRWKRAGATLWRTDRQGAIMAESTALGLAVQSQREARPRYWHGG